MQRSPPAWYLSFNIFMWGVLLMCEAASQNFATLTALRILSGAFEAIADPAFMLIVSMYYTRDEQPSRISAYYLWNGIGVAGGGLIGTFSLSLIQNHILDTYLGVQVTESAI
jgi:MFS family permease